MSILNAQTVPYQKYTSKDGLIADRITAISQDDQGFMWFGSYFGICRYNGIAFEKIRLSSSQQNKYVTFLSPAGHKMYAGFLFSGGLAEYDNGRVRAYYIHGKDSAASNEFVCLADEGDGKVLVCNSIGQLFRFNQGRFILLAQLNQKIAAPPKSIVKDRFNNIWIGTELGLYILPYPYSDVQTFYQNENIFSLAEKNDGRIFISRFDGKATMIESCAGWRQGFADRRTELLRSRLQLIPFSGNQPKDIWGIETGKGLFVIDNSRRKTYYNIPLDLNTDVSALFADREGNIWIANEPGVFKISNFNSKAYLFMEIAAGGGNLYQENDSTIWASNERSLYYIKEDSIVKIKLRNPAQGFYSLLHIDTKKNLWLGSWNEGLWKTRYDKSRALPVKDFSALGKNRIKPHVLVEDKENNIWIAGINGLFRMKNDSLMESYQPPNAGGHPAFIVCMAIDEDDQTIWLGDNAEGIIKLKYANGTNGHISYHVDRYITAKEGVTDSYIRSIFLDHSKNVWVGTRFGGIYRISEKAGKVSVKNCNAEAGLSCTRVTDITEEDSSAVWFATCDGMYRYDYHSGNWDHYGTSDGILNAEIYDILIDKSNGWIWGLSSQGVTRFRLHVEKKIPPLVSITSITVLGKVDTNALATTGVVQYAYNKNSIGFSFAGASFIDEKQVRYSYMLEGYDNWWSSPVMGNSINYASLPAGKYRFKVLAANAKGIWSKKPAVFSFEIILPFYKRTWFIFLLITLFIFIVYMIWIQRLKNRFRIEKIRLNIARDLHDDIGSTLGSINLLTKTATRKIDHDAPPMEVSPIFHQIGHSAEQMLEAMDDIVWSISPEKDKIQDLVIRMREFALPLLETKNIEYVFKTRGDVNQPISMTVRRNVFLIYKESVYNVLRHTEATNVAIQLQFDHQLFQMTITDNGKGFNTSLPSQRNGLKNMKKRAALVKGELEIASGENGTKVLFSAPLR